MDEKFQQAVKQLTKKCPSSSNVYNALVTIRTKYIKDNSSVADFRRLGGLQAVIQHLQKPNLKIVNVALSILGNCCLEPESRQVVRKHGGIVHVVNLLESLGQDDLQNRACRVLANLALDISNGDEILKKNGARLIIDVLASSKDEHTKVSALRAIRLLATTAIQRRNIVEQNGVESICKLLIVEETVVQETISLYVLKALALLTKDCNLECSHQLQNVQYAEKVVALLSSPNEEMMALALHVLSNMSKHETIRPLLGSAGAVPLLIAHVAKWEKASIGWQHAVIALCECTKEAVNRVRIRDEDGLVHLIGLFGDRDDERLWPCALGAMVNFIFDGASFTRLVELGLVTLLVERFRQLIADCERTKHDYDASRVESGCEREETSGNSCGSSAGFSSHACIAHTFPLSLPTNGQLIDWLSSNPRSQSSPRAHCYSPECSPPYWNSWGGGHLGSPPAHSSAGLSPAAYSSASMSPAAHSPHRGALPLSHYGYDIPKVPGGPSSCCSSSSERKPDATDDFCYSPVYDDDDADDNDADDVTAMAVDAGDSPSTTEPDTVSPGATPPNPLAVVGEHEDLVRLRCEGRVASPLGDVMLLLSRISMQEDARLPFVSSGAFVAVYEYVVGTPNPSGRAQRMLLRILRNPLYFECLLLHRIPQFLHHRLLEVEHPPSACSACNTVVSVCRLLLVNLNLMAESAFGCGVVLHMLLGKTEPDQKLMAITAANYLFKSNRSRRKVYLESGGLAMLIQWLEMVEHADYDDFLNSLVHFSRSLLSQTPIPTKDHHQSPFVYDLVECHYLNSRASSKTKNTSNDDQNDDDNDDDDVLLVVDERTDCDSGGKLSEVDGDGQSSVSAHPNGIVISRSFVSSRCEVFKAMLLGNFAETRATSVFIGDTTFEGLRYVVHYIHGCHPSACPAISDSAITIATMNQALATADRFLMPDLKLIVAEQMTRCGSQLMLDDWFEVLLNARLYGCHELLRWFYVDLLTADSSNLAAKRDRLRHLMSVEWRGEIVAVMQTLLHEALTVGQLANS